ncbi:MAG TPA: GPW/gp25 family protein [Longimicrobiales bacterium]
MHERYLSFPFRLTPDGRIETADEDRHIRQRLEQILFTSPGERVMLPEFGCGARDLVFAGNNEALAAAAEFRIAKALQTHMGDQVLINAVDVAAEGEQLRIDVVYTKARDLQQQTAVFRLFPNDAVSRG